jgi:hypothetical protein
MNVMRPVAIHVPGEPTEPEPPEHLLELSGRLHHPLVMQCGITTTRQGHWALYVTVPCDTSVPIDEIESQAAGFPVVYEAEPATPPKAWPARPDGR